MPFSVVEQMKNTNVNISMWDAIATIPMQKRLLQQELESIEPKDQPPNMESATSLIQPSKEVEKIKKTNVNISMWDVVATIPMQKRLLQQELESIEPKDQPPNIESATSLIQPSKEVETSKKVRPPPFYISLIIGDTLVHNCMIDSGASSSVMPRHIANLFGIKYEPMVRDVL